MGETIGAILPLAVGIAVSPIPIVAAILMLLSPRARVTGPAFLGGWVLGITVAVVVFALLASVLPAGGTGGAGPVAGAVKIALGLLLLVLAVRQWRARPAAGAPPVLPKWMSAVDGMTPPTAFGLGVLLSAVNPKNLLMAAGAGLDIGSSGLGVGGAAVATLVFVVLAAATVAVPVVGYLAASARMSGPLESLRGWLVGNNATVMSVLLLVIGVTMVGKGVGDF